MKIIFVFVLLISLANLCLGQDSEALVRQGDEFYSKFDLKSSIKYYEAAFVISPDDYTILVKLTRAYNDLGEDYYELRDRKNSESAINKALIYAEKLASEYPDSSMTYALLAMSYGNLAMFKGGNEKVKLAHKIKDNAEKSIGINPNNYLAYIILSIYHRQIASLSWLERAFANTFFGSVPDGSLEESEAMMLKALKINPGIVIAMFHLSHTYKEMDNEKKEKEWLQKVIDAPVIDFRDKYAKRKSQRRLNELAD